MEHLDIYKKAISILEGKGIKVNVNILEMACMLYVKKWTKLEAYNYLKQLNFNAQKTSSVLHIYECMKDLAHPVITAYADYVEAVRSAVA